MEIWEDNLRGATEGDVEGRKSRTSEAVTKKKMQESFQTKHMQVERVKNKTAK